MPLYLPACLPFSLVFATAGHPPSKELCSVTTTAAAVPAAVMVFDDRADEILAGPSLTDEDQSESAQADDRFDQVISKTLS